MRILKAATIAVILLLTVSGMWLYLSLRGHGFSTRKKPSGIEQFFAVRVRYLAMPSRADAMRNPLAAEAEAIAGGAEHFQETCAICHALDGSGKTDIGVGLYPPRALPTSTGPAAAGNTTAFRRGDFLHYQKRHPFHRHASLGPG